ncbi:DUF131 domain-containing protein [Methanosalsum natronophilum]|uniref:DUF131 domain-containing protein n=1 Tax=Methanosalsum natronophilum TaxID=768733 RepID=A0A3R7XIQ0_9EURY|nr:MAG: DUF131 domain-containing protein [Methanosalsum natronophilum]
MSNELNRTAISLIILGFLLVFIGMIVNLFSNTDTNNGISTEFGGIVMIGPIPIIVGTSPEITGILIGLAIILILVYMFVWRKM